MIVHQVATHVVLVAVCQERASGQIDGEGTTQVGTIAVMPAICPAVRHTLPRVATGCTPVSYEALRSLWKHVGLGCAAGAQFVLMVDDLKPAREALG
ncbi:hypothetical protein [Streptomyces sp. NPDC127066]|uniref:hypothetical protein n=1 Tax=Streptomyces sp. NPDC127066 TaxID=3347125 RepID=UPI0036503375